MSNTVLTARSLLVIVFAVSGCFRTAEPADGQWRYYGGDPGGSRFSSLNQINRTNVGRLAPAWVLRTGEVDRTPNISPDREPPAFETTPLYADGRLYLSTCSSRVLAADGRTGRMIWEFDPQAGSDRIRGFHQHRGVAYWSEGDRARILYGTLDGKLISLNADNGRPDPNFGDGGEVDLRRGAAENWPDEMFSVTSPPAVYGNLVITGARVPESPDRGPSGVVRAFRIEDGRPAWEFRTVPQPGEFGNETWDGDSWRDRTGANVWSIISVDVERGLVFLPVGAPAYDFYGGDRKGKNLFGNSLLALDAASGERVWHFQMVHHDLWDYDLPAQPVLADIVRDGRKIPAVAQVTKMGFVFLFHRETGEPLFEMESRPVPVSDVPGEEAWPTQPFPVLPDPISRLQITRSDLSPESSEYCLRLFESLQGGRIYSPIGCQSSLMVPGTLGGGNWSGGAFDPSNGALYVNANELPNVARIDCSSEMPDQPIRRLSRYERFVDENGWPCVAPPWGTLTAIDLATGGRLWRVPLGITEDLEGAGRERTGRPSLGGPIATAGGLVFIGGTTDRRFRAFDSRSGEELWSAELEASAHATPMTYRGADGRQYVVIAAGGGGYLSKDEVSDQLVAFALPEEGAER